MAGHLDREALVRGLLRELSSGPRAAPELAQRLDVSQPTLSRLVAAARDELLVVGRARSTRYARRRSIGDVGRDVPVYEVDEGGGAREICKLVAVYPEGFYVAATGEGLTSRFFSDLPYFLNDLRPSGFLGRLLPKRHPELLLPADVRNWSADHCLTYLTRFGWDLPGNLILGDAAFRRYLEESVEGPATIPANRRARVYAEMATDVLHAAPAGSSAAGEQPKLLATRMPGPKHVLVKFSPELGDATSRRYADLLVAEHVAHVTLARHGHEAASSQLLEGESRIFLEVERFDRTPEGGRRGMISLLSLDAEFIGKMKSWTESTALLATAGHVDVALLERVRFREWFGHLIANSDMHFANLSLLTRGTTVTDLAPAYDMLPMAYAPLHGNLTVPGFAPPIPDPAVAAQWEAICTAAEDFWSALARHPLVSRPFGKIAIANAKAVSKLRQLGARLPRA